MRADATKYNTLYLQGAMTRWRLIIQIAKLKTEEGKQVTLDDIMGSIQKGTSNMYMERVKELEKYIKDREVIEG